MIALLEAEATVLRTLILAIALIVAGLPTGMVCNRPQARVGTASSECEHATHHPGARLVTGGECSRAPHPVLVVRQEARRFVSETSPGAIPGPLVLGVPAGDSTHQATSLAPRQRPGWRGSPLVLRI